MFTPKWACSAVGSAPEWHSGGHRFESGQVHQPSLSRATPSESFGSASHASYAERELRLGEPGEGCCAEAAKPRRRASYPRQKMRRLITREMAQTAQNQSEGDKIGRGSGQFVAGRCVAVLLRMSSKKRFVYVLKNADFKPRFYVGLTSDVNARLTDHNHGRCSHTTNGRPWRLHVIIEFSDQSTAIRFERYLKSGSGRAFAKRHFES
jgi:putative endonuclease